MNTPQEPVITVNGLLLSVGQAMTIRVAVTVFATQMSQEGLGTDAHGKAMAEAYLARSNELLSIMLNEGAPV